MVHRVNNVMQVIFWTSVPLFAGYLAVSWALGADPLTARQGMALWLVVMASSGYLASQAFPPVPDEGANSEARTSESLVYPITMLLAASTLVFQSFY